jgi:hypothetical protein
VLKDVKIIIIIIIKAVGEKKRRQREKRLCARKKGGFPLPAPPRAPPFAPLFFSRCLFLASRIILSPLFHLLFLYFPFARFTPVEEAALHALTAYVVNIKLSQFVLINILYHVSLTMTITSLCGVQGQKN